MSDRRSHRLLEHLMRDGTVPQTSPVSAGFARVFGYPATVVTSAPGRVNLIGEHTDYTGGLVLPVALPLRLWVAGNRRADHRMRIAALDLDEVYEAGPDDAAPAAGAVRWSDYVRGVAWAMRQAGHEVGGCELALTGELPAGTGLSSSAALGVAVARALNELFNLSLAPPDLALLAHQAETEFVGLACGVMDQFASALGDEHHALLLDCRTLAYRSVPLPLAEHDATVFVIDSGCPRGLAGSAYNQRVAECAEATAAARAALPHRDVETLRDLTPDDLPLLQGALAPIPFRRARHVVTENARVSAALLPLKTGELPVLGRLLSASHASLRDDYEVSTAELDWLVAHASGLPAVYGARLTGAGFGGCVLVLAQARAEPAIEGLLNRYRAETGRTGRVVAHIPR